MLISSRRPSVDVHAIECSSDKTAKCGIQYVGQTGRQATKRTQEHLYRCRKPKKFKSIIYQPLDKHNHNIKFTIFQPLKTVQKQQGQSH